MGLANWLTVLRIVLVPVFVTLLVYERAGAALFVFVAAAATDSLDGWVARRAGNLSRLGAFLDPAADKLMVSASFVTLTYLGVLPFWITAVVISRDVILVVGAVAMHMAGVRVHPRPTRVGKYATFLQFVTVLTGLVVTHVPLPGLLTAVTWLAAAFTVVSGMQYIVQGVAFLNAAQSTEREDEAAFLR
jgi:cardiolipin synthase (CMP-forming)